MLKQKEAKVLKIRGEFNRPLDKMQRILDKLVRMYYCDIELDDIIKNKVFSVQPYEKAGSFQFL